ncbi:hypothetical protein CBR_g34232 [Chara braunii]|uniref:Uncharacterized protein n=1 Tax=Chara braunii TaxID=69332 RepID=A0A388JYG5_CHABU|nr:hypothetical protein CBR_g34232 [Chara braunii]|eukprot:GBG62861.1 hypothetical protein CBR_g34232 [Chara braunii]
MYQKENVELRKKETEIKQQLEGDLAALRWEIRDLKENREIMGRSELTKQIDDLRAEMEALRKRNEETEEVAQLWRNEALRPGNKRGSINISTPASEGRAAIRLRTATTPEETRRLRAELCDLQERRRCDQTEVDMLKERSSAAEVGRLKAEAEIARLREQMSQLATDGAGCSTPGGQGTNLKEKMEEAAKTGYRTGRRGRVKMTPGRLPRSDGSASRANDRYVFLQEERKRLRALKKSGLEPLCREMGVAYKNMDITVEELAQLNAERMFGGSSEGLDKVDVEQGRGKTPSEDSNIAVMEEIGFGPPSRPVLSSSPPTSLSSLPHHRHHRYLVTVIVATSSPWTSQSSLPRHRQQCLVPTAAAIVDAQVGLLASNILVEGTESDDVENGRFGCRVDVTKFEDRQGQAKISNVFFRFCGQAGWSDTNTEAVSFSLLDDDSAVSYVRKSSFADSYSSAVAVRLSSGKDIFSFFNRTKKLLLFLLTSSELTVRSDKSSSQ